MGVIYMKNIVLFCTGKSSSGKSTFIKEVLPQNSFYKLKSATTRPRREDELDGRDYYFRDEAYFEKGNFATYLWVNEAHWEIGVPKWLYGVPEFEIFDHVGQNFTYDVIQPKYIRQMIDWFHKKRLDSNYDFKIIWFQPMINAQNIIKKRVNMPDDEKIRRENTCDMKDFVSANLEPDFTLQFDPQSGYHMSAKGDDVCILPSLRMDVLLAQYNRYKMNIK